MILKPLIKNKRGSILDLFLWLAVSLVVVIFFAAWIYGFNQITTTLIGIKGTPALNVSAAAQDTFGQLDPIQTKGLHTIAFAMIFAMGLSILISNFLVKTHPAFFIVYIFVIIVAIIAAAEISNQYEKLMTSTVLGETITAFTGASFIMLNLPIWTAVIGIFGAIFLFAGIVRDAGAGGSVV